MSDILQILITACVAIFASSGFWAYIMQKKIKNDASDEMLRGLGHDRIMELGQTYIDRGYVTKDEYENLNDYLFKPYQKLNGNGTAEKIMKEVDKLPIKG